MYLVCLWSFRGHFGNNQEVEIKETLSVQVHGLSFVKLLRDTGKQADIWYDHCMNPNKDPRPLYGMY